MAENLNKIWAKSKPLKHYFDELLAAIRDQNSEQLIEQIKHLDIAESSTNLNRTLSSAAQSLAISNAEREYRSDAYDQLRNALIAEEIRLIGITDQDNSIVEIGPDYWIGADISAELNQARSDDRSFRDLRVLKAQYTPPTERPPTTGPKSAKSRRVAIITACLEAGLTDFDRDNIETRFAAYRRYIDEHHPHWDTRSKFSLKSFERDEKIFKPLKNQS
ncbi:hypothetical protein [Henriciella pelagia]|jgi:hypothetical protein|uniref:Uncharacterized protein n=1 Tax=Henriciella pelagia TaxID=1977912 RepID=A0ABQ1JME5_9PROT|nr:hypothetical protein [Henriciella pelagia]GGB70065.1 hypothetical protein GCM10011503_18430 [Henriciella pelagia]